MKRLLAAFCVLTALGANAQRAEWGLKAGLQISQLRGDDFLGRRATSSSATPETITTQGSSKAGYVVGAYVRSTEDVFLQAEALLSVKGGEIESTGSTNKTSIQYGQLDIPLSLGYKHKRLEFTGGPLISLQLFDDSNLKNFLSQYSSTPLTFSPYRTYAFGYHAGVALNLNKLSIGVRYLASIQGVSDMYIAYAVPGEAQLRDSRFQQRFSGLQFTASYRLTR